MARKLFIAFVLFFFARIQAQSFSQRYNQALKAFNEKDYALAYSLFESFLNERNIDDDLEAQVRYYAAESLFRMGQYEGAAQKFENFINLYEWSNLRLQAFFKLGIIYYNQGKYYLAQSRFERILINFPYNEYLGDVYFYLGLTNFQLQDYKSADKNLSQALEYKETNSNLDLTLYYLGFTSEKLNDYYKAIKYYDDLLSFHKGSKAYSLAIARIGFCYYKVGDYDNAILELTDNAINDLDDDLYFDAKYYLGLSYQRIKEYSNAEKEFLSALENARTNERKRLIQYAIAWNYFQMKNFKEAFKYFDRLANEGVDTIAINSLFWAAESRRYDNQSGDALVIYDQFLKQYPNHPLSQRVKYLMGIVLYDQANYTSSEAFINQAKNSLDPNVRAKAFLLSGEIDLQNKNYVIAKTNFMSALNIQGISQEVMLRAYLGLGIANYFLEKYREAANAFETIVKIQPSFERDKTAYYLGETYLELNENAKAIEQFKRISKREKHFEEKALLGEAIARFNMKDYRRAVYLFQDYLTAFPNSKHSLFVRTRIADCYYGIKEYAEATKIYREIYSNPSNIISDFANYQFAQALYRSGDKNGAIKEFRNLQQRFPKSKYVAESQYSIAWIYFQQGLYTKSIESYQELIQKYPNSPLVSMAYYSIGDAYFNLQDYNKAVENYSIVLEQYPNSPYALDAVNGIMFAYQAMNKPNKAAETIENYVSKNSSLQLADQAFLKIGDLYYNLGSYKKSAEYYKKFISQFPNSALLPNAYYWLGKSNANLNNIKEATDNFKNCFENFMNDEFAIASAIELGYIYKNKKDYKSAFEIYEKAAQKFSKSSRLAELLFEYGLALIENKKIEDAYKIFTRTLYDFPETIFAEKSAVEIGIIELARRNYKTADDLFRSVFEKRSDDIGAKAQYYYGESLLEQGQIQDAISAFVRVGFVYSAYDEWVTRSLLKLGDAYLALGDKTKAREMYQGVLRRHKTGEFASEAQKKLRGL